MTLVQMLVFQNAAPESILTMQVRPAIPAVLIALTAVTSIPATNANTL